MSVTVDTSYGKIKGNEREYCNEFLGVRYARAGRFKYAEPVDKCDEPEYDATHHGPTCPQTRQFYEHLEIPERMFYHKEFRDGITYEYDEDCLNLNIYTPKAPEKCPVIVFIYGGGFNSGSTKDSSFDGEAFAKNGVILVTISYRVGILGYMTNSDIKREFGREGNFGLDDQLTAIKWVKRHIRDFGGDPDNITLMGQSAGAISIQYLCLLDDCKGLFKRVVMMSGAGLFPKFALPRPAENTRGYWLEYMDIAGAKTLDELRTLDLKTVFTAIEEIKKRRKDNTYCTMPVIDGVLIKKPVDELINSPIPLDNMIGFTNNDMYAPLMAHISLKYAARVNGYAYYFDRNAPGDDNNAAFHSADLRYVFGTLNSSHRPYDARDYAISAMMTGYISNFAATGDPNGKDLPLWERKKGKALCIGYDNCKMAKPRYFTLVKNMITKGDPK